ncbi:hypothetical protein PIB30_045876 [Stylosanthes scabra]|uniref:Uncharacterized protein n=1 Tax=Stylosanthes scabra TaxID=79078 RepID=A0ABU6RGB7_9FABA|nr:hypothetical protein [Stylosanthes scabra]
MQVNNEIHLESFNTFEYESESVPPTPSTQDPSVIDTSSSKGKKRKASDINPSQLEEISTAMKEIAHAIVNTRPRVRQTSELFEAIRSLGVQDDKLFETVDWLAEHPTSIDAVEDIEAPKENSKASSDDAAPVENQLVDGIAEKQYCILKKQNTHASYQESRNRLKIRQPRVIKNSDFSASPNNPSKPFFKNFTPFKETPPNPRWVTASGSM